jgi:hypothetical protein
VTVTTAEILASIDADTPLAELVDVVIRKLRTAELPELVKEEVTDDGETYWALRCPVCEELVSDSDDLYTVDFAERWSSVTPRDEDWVEVSEGDSTFDGAYYLHDRGPRHLVRLPDGWTEEW